MKIIANSIINIYKQVKKNGAMETKALVSFQSEKVREICYDPTKGEEGAATLFRRNTGKKQPCQGHVSRDDVPGLGEQTQSSAFGYFILIAWPMG